MTPDSKRGYPGPETSSYWVLKAEFEKIRNSPGFQESVARARNWLENGHKKIHSHSCNCCKCKN